jgi:hypothetical protein
VALRLLATWLDIKWTKMVCALLLLFSLAAFVVILPCFYS